MKFWEAHREKAKSWKYQLLTGLPLGLIFSLPILLLLFTARLWFAGADMEANAFGSPVILGIAVLLIATFVAIFYKNHQWEMREQQYLSLKAREKAETSTDPGH